MLLLYRMQEVQEQFENVEKDLLELQENLTQNLLGVQEQFENVEKNLLEVQENLTENLLDVQENIENNIICDLKIDYFELDDFFTSEELSKMKILKSKNITLISSDYQYNENNNNNFTMNIGDKLAGWGNNTALLYSELSGVNIQYNHTTTDGLYPVVTSLWGDPMANIGLPWGKTPQRDLDGKYYSSTENGLRTLKIVVLEDDKQNMKNSVISVPEDTTSISTQLINLSTKGWTIILPPAGNLTEFARIDVLISENPQIKARYLDPGEWAFDTFVLNSDEYYLGVNPIIKVGAVMLEEIFGSQDTSLGIYLKNDAPYFNEIDEVFDIISKSGLPNSLGMNTKFEGAINKNNTIPLAGENIFKLVCSADKLPLLLSRETILFDNLQQGDFKGDILDKHDNNSRTIGHYYKIINENIGRPDQSGLRSTNVLTVLKVDRGAKKKSFIVTSLPNSAILCNNLNSKKLNV